MINDNHIGLTLSHSLSFIGRIIYVTEDEVFLISMFFLRLDCTNHCTATMAMERFQFVRLCSVPNFANTQHIVQCRIKHVGGLVQARSGGPVYKKIAQLTLKIV